MITKLKKIHYCDYCGKHGMRKSCIEKHEKHCTLNPKRECRLCGRKSGNEDSAQLSLETLITQYKKISRIEQVVNGVDIDKLGSDVGYCPACILTIIRCAGLQAVKFDYHEALKEWWYEKNEEAKEIDYANQNWN